MLTILSIALGVVTMDASAQVSGGSNGRQAGNKAAAATSPAIASPRERGELTRQFVNKWGIYAQRVYGVPVRVWARRMVPSFVAADAVNFRNALKRDTFEGAMAELGGSGHRISDSKVIDTLAKAKAGSVANTLGSATGDLVYTPIQPCRIVDTRNTLAGPVAANSDRSFVSVNQADFTAQGGSASNCGTLGVNASAVAFNITAVLPAGRGHAVVYSFGMSKPLASSVNYAAGSITNNGVITQIPSPLSTSDFTLYSSAQSDYVVDIVGYFAPPEATALDCTSTFASETVSANGIFDIQIPACTSGYTMTGAGCRTPGFNEANWAINGLFKSGQSLNAYCSGTNLTAGNITVEGVAQCCRVPGR